MVTGYWSRAAYVASKKITDAASAMAWVVEFSELPATTWHFVCQESYGYLVDAS